MIELYRQFSYLNDSAWLDYRASTAERRSLQHRQNGIYIFQQHLATDTVGDWFLFTKIKRYLPASIYCMAQPDKRTLSLSY